MLAIESLSDKDRKDLDAIKKSFEKPALTRDQELLSTKNVLISLEKKVDQMHDIDKKKVFDVKKVMQEYTSDLTSLKANIQDPTKKLDEYKKKTFDTIKQDLEKHRWSSWLAGPVYAYFIEKYIDKKPVSPLKDWIAKYIGIPLVGLFLPKSLTTVLDKLDTLSLDDISGKIPDKIENGLRTLEQLAPAELEKLKAKLIPDLHKQFEKLTWHRIDITLFKGVAAKWLEKWKKDIHEANQATMNLAKTGTWNPLDVLANYLVIGPKASFDLIVMLSDAKIIKWDDLAMESVDRSWKTMFRIGMSSFGLFSRYFDCVFGELSADDLTEYVKNNVSGISIESKAAIWWLMYRHWGIFWSLMGKIGDLTGHLTGFMFGGKVSWDVSKFSAYWSAWLWWKVEKELAVIENLEKNLVSSGMLGQKNYRNTGPVLHDLITILKQNTKIFALAQQAKTTTELASLLKSNWITHLWTTSVDDFVRPFTSLAQLKSAIGHSCSSSITANINDASRSFWTVKKMLAKVLPKTPWSKYPMEVELLDTVRSYARTQETLLRDDRIFAKVRNFYTKFEHAKNLSNIVEHWEKVKFHLKTVSEAKDFFDNVAYIWKSSPEILRTLFKGFPLIMVGKEVLDWVFSSDPAKKNQSLIMTIGKAIWYVTPVVWPILLIHDSLALNNYVPTDLAWAGIGAGMLAYDVFCGVKATYVKWWLLKYMTSPVRDAVSFVKSLGQGTYTMFKMAKDLTLVAKVEWLGALGREWLKYLRKMWLRTAVLAALVLLGYFTWKEFFDGMSEEEKKMFAGLQDKSPEEREKWIAEQWKTMPDDQKSLFLKVASSQRLWFPDPDFVDVSKSWTTYTVKVKQLVSLTQLAQTKFELQQAIDSAEGVVGKAVVQYTLDGGALETRIEEMTKDGSTKDQIKAYLLELGYSVQDVDQMIKKV